MTGKKYEKYVFSGLREDTKMPFVASPQAYFRGGHQIPGAGANMGWQLFVKPVRLETEPHIHNADEYLIFLGHDPADWFGSFDAQIEFYLGEEMEKYTIDKPTIIYIPPKLLHCPLDFKVINKPVVFTALLQEPYFTKIMNGKEYKWVGPGSKDNNWGEK